MTADTAIATVRLRRIRRGVSHPKRTAEFYAWLLDLEMEAAGSGYRLTCANGDLVFDDDAATPVAFDLSTSGEPFRGADPDGVPVTASAAIEGRSAPATLDHLRLNCADLSQAIGFYKRLGFVLTWSGVGVTPGGLRGPQEEPMPGADWVHLSGADGYLSLSQADWQPYGLGLTASGPPRFMHIGLGVADMASVRAQLEAAGVSYFSSSEPGFSERLYLNDPDGDAGLGPNLELNQYEPEIERSGRITDV